jgi:hypothetical protein
VRRRFFRSTIRHWQYKAKIIEKCPCEGQKAGKYFRCRLKSEIADAADHPYNADNRL